MRLIKIVHEFSGARLVPPSSLKLDLDAAESSKPQPPARSARRPIGARPSTDGAPGWWTVRATAGEVRPGFTKEAILRKPEGDPREKGGVFDRLGSLLDALGGGAAR
jgi:hypothetical protein